MTLVTAATFVLDRTLSQADDGRMTLTRKQALAYLNKDGDLHVPCPRYGRSTSECAPVAYRVAKIVAYETGNDLDEEQLDYAMSLVVNDHDDVAYLMKNYR